MLPQTLGHPGLPEEGYALPDFSLEAADGRTVRLWTYKQRRPVLLVFAHGSDCAACCDWLRALAARQPELDDLRVVVCVVVRATVEQAQPLRAELGSAATVLCDVNGTVATRYLPHAAEDTDRCAPAVALYAADRYLHCLGRWFGEEAHTLPPLDQLLAEFAFAAQEGCGCGLPVWPAR